ncbi:hypothetical protein JCM10213_003385 [Rhodosporidiobolus nylandii]
MLRQTARAVATSIRTYITAAHALSPHPALTLVSSFLSPAEQSTLLRASLTLLDSPSRTTAAGRKKRREWLKAHPGFEGGFMGEEAYAWEEGHFDGVIKRYREMLVRPGMWGAAGEEGELGAVLQKVYSLLPPPSSSASSSSGQSANPPPHLIMHLLHLSSAGAIHPHVDNVEAFGQTICGVSLGGERVMRFKRVSEPLAGMEDGPDEFSVLVEKGSAYIQQEPLRTHYTHEVLETAEWEGRMVGGSQRLSIMLRDRLPSAA